MSKILTISGQRGGTGKSVTALNLAVSLSLYEKNVLLIDCDPQGCVTEWSGIKTTGYPFDLAAVLNGKATLFESIAKTEFSYLDILPSGFDLFGASLKLARRTANEKLLRLLMEEIRAEYDYILLDSPASSGYLSVAAMTAADALLVPMCCGVSQARDFQNQLRMIQYIRKTHQSSVKLAGLVFNRCQSTQEIQTFLKAQNLQEAGHLVYDSFIPEDPAVARSIEENSPLALLDIKSQACQGYLACAREVIGAFNSRGDL